jgi:hypothetical protein
MMLFAMLLTGTLLAAVAWWMWADPFTCRPRRFGTPCIGPDCEEQRRRLEAARIGRQIAPGSTQTRSVVSGQPESVLEPPAVRIRARVAPKPVPVPRKAIEAGD